MRLAALIFAALLLWALTGRLEAAPILTAEMGGVRVVLYNEPCALDAISNLPNRAQWIEAAQSYEGCYGWDSDAKVVIAYFSDGAVALIPMRYFVKVRGA